MKHTVEQEPQISGIPLASTLSRGQSTPNSSKSRNEVEHEPVGAEEIDIILRSVAGGSRSEFMRLYDTMAPKLFAVLLRMVGRHEVAENLLHDTFVHIWCHAPDFDGSRASAQAWLYGIVRRKAVQRLRTSNREFLGRSEDATLENHAFDERGAPIDPEFEAPFQHAHKTLEPDQYRAIRLCLAYGFTHEELAAHLNVPLTKVESWITRGLQQLRISIDK